MNKDAPRRKLATILATDVVGFSSLKGMDEKGAITALAERRKIPNAPIAQHGGRFFTPRGIRSWPYLPVRSLPCAPL